METAAKGSDAPLAAPNEEPSTVSLGSFLTNTPPLVEKTVAQGLMRYTGTNNFALVPPTIELHCPSKICGGTRIYDPRPGADFYNLKDPKDKKLVLHSLIHFVCRNCASSTKVYAVRLTMTSINATSMSMLKVGEFPGFGEPRPNVIRDVLEDEVEYFERGYRAEMAGLGIGAFAYYRRFVESHKDRIIDEIRKVATSQGASSEMLETLDRARKMTSFEQAVKTVKDAIPDSLRYRGGHNPLTLLHTALSRGLHNEDDGECLELAQDIRLLLTDLAERTSLALRNDDALGQAVKRLLKKNSKNS